MAIDGSRIQRIAKEGLFYLDENDQEQFIDFMACYERDLAEYLKSEHSPDHIEKRKTSWRYVAARDVIGDSRGHVPMIPYMRFYTDPPILFEFATKEAFYEVRYAIEKIGWRTYDLS